MSSKLSPPSFTHHTVSSFVCFSLKWKIYVLIKSGFKSLKYYFLSGPSTIWPIFHFHIYRFILLLGVSICYIRFEIFYKVFLGNPDKCVHEPKKIIN